MSSKTFPKRFYKTVGVKAEGGGFVVTLDGRVLKTPGKQILLCPTRDHANLIAAEWEAVTTVINPAQMPLTRLLNVAVERTPHMRDDLIAEARRYGATDLLCYRADTPQALVDMQSAEWDPWLDWARGQGIDLTATAGVLAIDQSAEALDAIAARASALDDLQLTLLVHLTAVFGSVILALAVINRALAAGAAFDISRLDARFQIDRWGEDEEAAEIAAATRGETVILSQFI